MKKIREPLQLHVDKELLRWAGPIHKSPIYCLRQRHQEIRRLRIRRKINVNKISSEVDDINQQFIHQSRQKSVHVRKTMISWGADQTGFLKLTRDSTLKFKNGSWQKGKQSKVRYTVLVYAKMTGSERLKLMIGKYKKPIGKLFW